ncbi:MAG TPA: UbiD family decarboxylase, partial [Pelotomaculum sp.]|nr:UbiD family decarboxylase [Pelotomaculum sp.]
EGPFGEWTGYYGLETMSPVVDVQAIYHRNSPILLGCPHSKPPDETAFFKAVFRSALLEDSLRRSGIPGVQGCWGHEIGGGRMLIVVSIKQQYAGHASQAGHVAASCQIGALLGRYVVVVDEDIDVTNLSDVVWAVLTRSDPASSVDIIKRAWGSPLDPRMDPADKKNGRYLSSRAIVEATKPFEWKDLYPITVSNWPIVEQIRAKWEFLRNYI